MWIRNGVVPALIFFLEREYFVYGCDDAYSAVFDGFFAVYGLSA